jgi:hypothetical protein
VLGAPAVSDAAAQAAVRAALSREAPPALAAARSNAFGTPAAFDWGWSADNGGTGAVVALAAAAGRLDAGWSIATGARDYLLGRNPWGRSFVVGYGPGAPRHPHTWASVFGPGKPVGAVVGGPAPRSVINGQHMDGVHPRDAFNSPTATYEDNINDYVTSEPALDYTANSLLLMAVLAAR